MEKELIEKLADIEANTEIRSPDFEELNDRLLKGKFELMQSIGKRNYDGLTKAQGNIQYLKGLQGFLENIKNYLSVCRYSDDDRVKELCWTIKKIINNDIDIAYWVDEQEAINERISKDKANEFEAENIEILNEGL